MSDEDTIGLCFKAAHEQACHLHETAKAIDEYSNDTFYRHLLRHFQELRHPEDEPPFEDVPNRPGWSRASTVMAIRRAALGEGYEPLSDTQAEVLFLLFLACESGSVEQVRFESGILDKLGVPQSLYIQPLAVLAIDLTSVECLKFCKDKGARYDDDMKGALGWYFDHSEREVVTGMLDWAYENDWRNIRSNQENLSRFAGATIKRALSHGAHILNWFLDRGADLTDEEIWHACCTSVHEDAMTKLLQLYKAMAIRVPSLQAAVVNYQIETAKLLIRAGAPINTGKSNFAGPNQQWAESPMGSALVELISPKKLKDPDTKDNLKKRLRLVRTFIDWGADVDDVDHYGKSPRELIHTRTEYPVPNAMISLCKRLGIHPVKGRPRYWIDRSSDPILAGAMAMRDTLDLYELPNPVGTVDEILAESGETFEGVMDELRELDEQTHKDAESKVKEAEGNERPDKWKL